MRHPVIGVAGSKPRAASIAQILAKEEAQKRKLRKKRKGKGAGRPARKTGLTEDRQQPSGPALLPSAVTGGTEFCATCEETA
jgi:hypothetical protein